MCWRRGLALSFSPSVAVDRGGVNAFSNCLTRGGTRVGSVKRACKREERVRAVSTMVVSEEEEEVEERACWRSSATSGSSSSIFMAGACVCVCVCMCVCV